MKEEFWHVLWVVGPVTQAIKLHSLLTILYRVPEVCFLRVLKVLNTGNVQKGWRLCRVMDLLTSLIVVTISYCITRQVIVLYTLYMYI